MKVITTILAVLALASISTVNAQEKGKGKGNPEAAFKKMDSNGDGSVSKDEFMASPMAKKDAAKAEKAFGGKDKDKDGKLSKEEFMAQGKKKSA